MNIKADSDPENSTILLLISSTERTLKPTVGRMNMDEKTADPGAVDAKIQNVHGESPMDHDAVFGEITDEGPNYRSVSTPDDKLSFIYTQSN